MTDHANFDYFNWAQNMSSQTQNMYTLNTKGKLPQYWIPEWVFSKVKVKVKRYGETFSCIRATQFRHACPC